MVLSITNCRQPQTTNTSYSRQKSKERNVKGVQCIPFSSSETISDKSSSKLASPTCLIGRPTGSIAPPCKYITGRSCIIIHLQIKNTSVVYQHSRQHNDSIRTNLQGGNLQNQKVTKHLLATYVHIHELLYQVQCCQNTKHRQNYNIFHYLAIYFSIHKNTWPS